MATDCMSSTNEKSNFARLCRLLMDGGTQVLRDLFDSIYPSSSLYTVLHSPAVHTTLQWFRTRRVLTTHHWTRLYPSIRKSLSSSSFDISLLFVLVRNICGLTPPPGGWDEPPLALDMSKEADLARIQYYRNELYGHISETSISDSDFHKYWNEITGVLVRLGGSDYTDYKRDIKKLKVEAMEPEDEQYFIKIFEEWGQLEQTLITNLKMDEVPNVNAMEGTSVANGMQTVENLHSRY